MISATMIAEDLIGSMRSAGVVPAECIAAKLITREGQIIRFKCEGDRHENGFALLHLDGRPAGTFGNWRLGIQQNWTSGAPSHADPKAALSMRRKAFEQEEERRKRHFERAAEAERIIHKARVANPAHPYLLRKRLPPAGLLQSGNRLLAPMTDIFGKVWNCQSIYPDGEKRYLTGARKKGALWSAGLDLCLSRGSAPETICIGEGVATMIAVRVASGHPVVAAMDTSGLLTVATSVRRRWPNAKLIISADDDRQTELKTGRNTGMAAAEVAAAAVNGLLATPILGSDDHD